MTTIGTWITTKLFGTLKGEDEYGNRYYESKKMASHGRKRRWVIYNGIAEPSKVPAYMHGWLHYTREDFPSREEQHKYAWQKDSKPNLTGTKLAYLPPGHVNKGAQRSPATADYQPWRP